MFMVSGDLQRGLFHESWVFRRVSVEERVAFKLSSHVESAPSGWSRENTEWFRPRFFAFPGRRDYNMGCGKVHCQTSAGCDLPLIPHLFLPLLF